MHSRLLLQLQLKERKKKDLPLRLRRPLHGMTPPYNPSPLYHPPITLCMLYAMRPPMSIGYGYACFYLRIALCVLLLAMR